MSKSSQILYQLSIGISISFLIFIQIKMNNPITLFYNKDIQINYRKYISINEFKSEDYTKQALSDLKKYCNELEKDEQEILINKLHKKNKKRYTKIDFY